MAEIAPGLHRIDTPLGERVNTIWLVRGTQRSLMFDCGVDGAVSRHVLPYLSANGIAPEEVELAVVSHADVDHFGGVADTHAVLPRAQVQAHELDAAQITDYPVFEAQRVRGFQPDWGVDESPEGIEWCRSVSRVDRLDGRVNGDESYDLGDRTVEVRHLPGHTRGQVAVHDSATDAWLVSDAVLGDSVPLSDGTAAFAPTYRYVDDYCRSIEQLTAADPALLCTAHYGHRNGRDAREFLATSRSFVDELETVLRAALAELGRSTLRELLPVVNARIARWPLTGTEGSLAYPLVGHLERFEARGEVDVQRSRGTAATVIFN